MTTLTSSPSISPKPFSVPSSRSPVYRSAPSSSTSTPFTRRKPSSPLPSTTAAARHRDVPAPAPVSAADSSSEAVLRDQAERALKITRSRDFGTQYTPPGYPPTAPVAYRQVAGSKEERKEEGKGKVGADKMNGPDLHMTDRSPDDTVQNKDVVPMSSKSNQPLQQTKEQSLESPLDAAKSKSSSSSISLSSLVHAVPSSPKKLRSDPAKAKFMPRDYMQCNVMDLGLIISDMLLELIAINDEVPPKPVLTRFHSRAPPTISVRDYVNRLIFHATLSPPLLLAMVYYIDRLCALYPAFTITSLTVHRFLITAATVAAKGLSDSFWTNNTYARVGGVSTHELAMLELDFLVRLDWNIVPKAEVLEDYYHSLVTRAGDYVLESKGESQTHTDAGA
jgi:Cyclin